MAGTVRLYVTSTLANYLPRSPSQRACRGGMYGLVGVYGRPGPWLACLLPSFPCASRPSSHFRSSHANAASRCLRTALLRSPYLLPFLSRYPSLPFLFLACSCRIAALYLLLEAFAFSVFGWWDSDIDEGGRGGGGGGGGGGEGESRRRRRRRRRKAGSFCLLDT